MAIEKKTANIGGYSFVTLEIEDFSIGVTFCLTNENHYKMKVNLVVLKMNMNQYVVV